ncbi:MAG: hypothetical protein ACJA1T_000378 [Zhongshania aliphaticivorans]|jgi:hypothetical protein|uniref:CPXCG motif-containing cysteine-rich protein n=1 Tax=Zhongshania aliphaticivorans TaxID=1470434 RepID=A0A127M342_9GAMM|nr:CPXCG motif-containing cysteine-rich protein [Zhongshania aliphaticivorans]AMO67631.1 hypothetical protein AZF00_04675 [Zhongshania aliphaticivorans]EIF44973.1 hypothetical protein DOK_00984 [gamma proteobacterium BDW918]|tara:strand:- start:11328 stop:11525 length:198 start_codon:yes stop_codon:yes gene_type:complete
MNALESVSQRCPYCGERIELLIDTSEGAQTYVEDCQVCCQPMVISAWLTEVDDLNVTVFTENDAY